MKLMFICGSMEPGRDGVGDYTRRLAAELVRMGHEARVIALNDRKMEPSAPAVEMQADGATAIEVLRLPVSMPWKARGASARAFVERHSPDLVSLQFVPYSFQPKGLPFCLARRLRRIGRGYRWEVMFHELWLGTDRQASLKHRIVGFLQRMIVRRMLRMLRPATVHTQTAPYRSLLERIGAGAKLLPLFGNIPVSHPGRACDPDALVVTVFGSIHPGADADRFASWLSREGERLGRPVRVDFIGHNGEERERWLRVLQQRGVGCNVLGRQSEQAVSRQMQRSSVGLSTVPYPLVEKSGSVAAMLEHGLPVLCCAHDWESRDDVAHQVRLPVVSWNESLLLDGVVASDPGYAGGVAVVAQLFIDDVALARIV